MSATNPAAVQDPIKGLVTLTTISKMTGVPRFTLEKWKSRGYLPRPKVTIGGNIGYYDPLTKEQVEDIRRQAEDRQKAAQFANIGPDGWKASMEARRANLEKRRPAGGLTMNEAARRAEISYDSIRNAVRRDELTRVDGWILESDLDAWLGSRGKRKGPKPSKACGNPARLKPVVLQPKVLELKPFAKPRPAPSPKAAPSPPPAQAPGGSHEAAIAQGKATKGWQNIIGFNVLLESGGTYKASAPSMFPPTGWKFIERHFQRHDGSWGMRLLSPEGKVLD